MAESQGSFEYDCVTLSALENGLSPSRLSTYLAAAGHHKEYAIQLYLFNSRVSKAFLFPLQALEVVLRNAMSDIFETEYGPNWIDEPKFITALSPESLDSLQRAKARFNTAPRTHDVVAQLTFDFWSNLFRKRYGPVFWQKNIKKLFKNKKLTRRDVQQEVIKLNRFRNRIAHHESILKETFKDLYQDIIGLISAISPKVASWVHKHSTVNMMVDTRPLASGGYGPTMQSRMDNSIQKVNSTISLADLKKIKTSKFILSYSHNNIESIITDNTIGNHLLSYEDVDGLIDLNDITMSEIANDKNNNFVKVHQSEPINTLMPLLKKTVSFAVVIDNNLEPVGIIEKAHRRY